MYGRTVSLNPIIQTYRDQLFEFSEDKKAIIVGDRLSNTDYEEVPLIFSKNPLPKLNKITNTYYQEFNVKIPVAFVTMAKLSLGMAVLQQKPQSDVEAVKLRDLD